MPLTWNISKVENYKEKISNPKLKSILEVLIRATMIIGIRKITKQNYKKFALRIMAYEFFNRTILVFEGNPYHIKVEDVKEFIGLTTNANEKSSSEFEKMLLAEI